MGAARRWDPGASAPGPDIPPGPLSLAGGARPDPRLPPQSRPFHGCFLTYGESRILSGCLFWEKKTSRNSKVSDRTTSIAPSKMS